MDTGCCCCMHGPACMHEPACMLLQQLLLRPWSNKRGPIIRSKERKKNDGEGRRFAYFMFFSTAPSNKFSYLIEIISSTWLLTAWRSWYTSLWESIIEFFLILLCTNIYAIYYIWSFASCAAKTACRIRKRWGANRVRTILESVYEISMLWSITQYKIVNES